MNIRDIYLECGGCSCGLVTLSCSYILSYTARSKLSVFLLFVSGFLSQLLLGYGSGGDFFYRQGF